MKKQKIKSVIFSAVILSLAGTCMINAAENTEPQETAIETADDELEGQLLPDFCNDDDLREWFENIEDNLPDTLVYTSDRWYHIEDPELIREVLDALKQVRIGDVSTEIVGASGRQVFEFIYEDGESVTFSFFQDQIKWGRAADNHDVLDWGGLDELGPKLIEAGEE